MGAAVPAVVDVVGSFVQGVAGQFLPSFAERAKREAVELRLCPAAAAVLGPHPDPRAAARDGCWLRIRAARQWCWLHGGGGGGWLGRRQGAGSSACGLDGLGQWSQGRDGACETGWAGRDAVPRVRVRRVKLLVRRGCGWRVAAERPIDP